MTAKEIIQKELEHKEKLKPFERMLYSKMLQDLEHKEQLEKENQELKDKLNQEFEDSANEICKALTERDEYYNELEDLKLILSDVAFILCQVPRCEPEVERLELVDKALDKLKILEKENQELAEAIQLSNEYIAKVERTKVDLINENKELKKAIKIAKDKIGFIFHIDDDNKYYFSSKYLCNELTEEEYKSLKEVLE